MTHPQRQNSFYWKVHRRPGWNGTVEDWLNKVTGSILEAFKDGKISDDLKKWALEAIYNWIKDPSDLTWDQEWDWLFDDPVGYLKRDWNVAKAVWNYLKQHPGALVPFSDEEKQFKAWRSQLMAEVNKVYLDTHGLAPLVEESTAKVDAMSDKVDDIHQTTTDIEDEVNNWSGILQACCMGVQELLTTRVIPPLERIERAIGTKTEDIANDTLTLRKKVAEVETVLEDLRRELRQITEIRHQVQTWYEETQDTRTHRER